MDDREYEDEFIEDTSSYIDILIDITRVYTWKVYILYSVLGTVLVVASYLNDQSESVVMVAWVTWVSGYCMAVGMERLWNKMESEQ